MNKTDIDLLAPCGMDCAHCAAYLNLAYGKKRQCAGCLPRNKKCAFLKGRCKKLWNKEIRFCFECEGFPCDQLLKLEKRYQKRGWPNSFVENLKEIKEIGAEKFVLEQERRFRCPKCGGPSSIHSGTCYQCGHPVTPSVNLDEDSSAVKYTNDG